MKYRPEELAVTPPVKGTDQPAKVADSSIFDPNHV